MIPDAGRDYPINVFYSEEDGCWVADIPDLRTCSAFGDTPDAPLWEVLVARAGWLETAHANGKPIPLPRYRPALREAASG